jgi:flagellin
MGLFVNINVSSLDSQRQRHNTGQALSTYSERLSSDFMINCAIDDAAGLRSLCRLTTQVQGLNQAVQNANDATLLAQATERALGGVATSLQSICTLAVQSKNSINLYACRTALQKEVTALKNNTWRIVSDPQFFNLDISENITGTRLFTRDTDFAVETNESARD